MIPMDFWIREIIDYGRFICSEVEVRRAWIGRDFSGTSITDFDELIEQIFDDLDADSMVEEARQQLTAQNGLVQSIAAFLAALNDVDKWWTPNVNSSDVNQLLESEKWKHLGAAAQQMIHESVSANRE